MKKDSAILLGIIAVIIVGMVGVFALTGSGEQQPTASESVDASKLVRENSYKQGKGPVTIVEFGDFQCPACARTFPDLQKLKSEMGEQITFVFRHFPIDSIHKNARISANAAEAAGVQGKFFEMHDLLYLNQEQWAESADPMSEFRRYAGQIGLDEARFVRDVESRAYNDKISADQKDGEALGVNATPTIFIDGKKVTATDYDTLKKAVEEAGR